MRATPLTRNMIGEVRHDGAGLHRRAGVVRARRCEVAPKWSLVHRNLGLLHVVQKDVDGAIVAYRKGIEATNYDAQLVADLSALLEKQGHHDESIAMFEKLSASQPKLALAANNLAMLLVTYRSDAASLTRARDLTAPFASATDGNLLDTFGWVRFKRGEQAEGSPRSSARRPSCRSRGRSAITSRWRR